MITNGKIAQIAHEAHRAYNESQGDFSTPSWASLPQGEKDALIETVTGIREGKNTSPVDLHKAWVEKKTSQGWVCKKVEEEKDGEKVFTLVPKDSLRKFNPLMVEFDELSPEDRFKNDLLMGIVRVFDPVPDSEPVKEPETQESEEEKPEEIPVPEEPVKPKPRAKKPRMDKASPELHEKQKKLREKGSM